MNDCVVSADGKKGRKSFKPLSVSTHFWQKLVNWKDLPVNGKQCCSNELMSFLRKVFGANLLIQNLLWALRSILGACRVQWSELLIFIASQNFRLFHPTIWRILFLMNKETVIKFSSTCLLLLWCLSYNFSSSKCVCWWKIMSRANAA